MGTEELGGRANGAGGTSLAGMHRMSRVESRRRTGGAEGHSSERELRAMGAQVGSRRVWDTGRVKGWHGMAG